MKHAGKFFMVNLVLYLLTSGNLSAQQTFPVNGIPDQRNVYYAFINATIFVDHQTRIDSAMLLIKNERIEAIGKNLKLPADVVIFNLHNKFIYPSFIDPYTAYGVPEPEKPARKNAPQIQSNTSGAYGWNQAIKSETDASRIFKINTDDNIKFRKGGFGVVMTHVPDGIARGSGALVTLADGKEQEVILRERAAAFFSFKKGTSQQDYPTSQMGAIALLRQTFLDASWYRNGGREKERNLSLEAWNANAGLVQIFEAEDKLEILRAHKTGEEFGVKYVIKGSGNEYQRADEIKKTGCSLILPLRFPDSYDVSDPADAMNMTLAELKHWEMAPANAAFLYKTGIQFAFTAYGLKDPSEFPAQLRKVIRYGLPEQEALKACTTTPAALLNISQTAGALRKGMPANFIITSSAIFSKDAVVLENWIQGKQYVIKKSESEDFRGVYRLTSDLLPELKLKIQGVLHDLKAVVSDNNDSARTVIKFDNGILTLSFDLKKPVERGNIFLTGYPYGDGFKGTGVDSSGRQFAWNAVKTGEYVQESKQDSASTVPVTGDLLYPNMAYGWKKLPVARNTIIRNVTVWTNEETGIVKNTDVYIENGKIAAIGNGLKNNADEIIDGTGMHLTPGIIDEHSHIAISGNVNECSHAVTSEVRIEDIIDSDDIQIYRQLAGGVTTSQLLHGSCNPVGGQAALIKLRWGLPPDQLKFKGADKFIKFALGENVKQTNWGEAFTIRYPQTRMGVEQVYISAFTKANEYRKLSGDKSSPFRRDLRTEALLEILDKKRYITCHSYQQGEINMLLHVADSMNFKVNTFTHVLEGYKVADKLKKHGAGASTFSDWWAYKYEVIEAIPYNGALLHKNKVITAYNSDDPEMARRLNQEAAKAVKYGGVSEEEALKFVTLNPAKLLHIDNRVGSIKTGKDADLVLWTDNPLSVYAKVVKTFIDGICYYDSETDKLIREEIKTERNRLARKMTSDKAKPGSTDVKKPSFKLQVIHHCIDEE